MTLNSSSMQTTVRLDLEMPSKNPCWDGYVQVGMKNQNGKKVPNCVPEGKGKDKVAKPKKGKK